MASPTDFSNPCTRAAAPAQNEAIDQDPSQRIEDQDIEMRTQFLGRKTFRESLAHLTIGYSAGAGALVTKNPFLVTAPGQAEAGSGAGAGHSLTTNLLASSAPVQTVSQSRQPFPLASSLDGQIPRDLQDAEASSGAGAETTALVVYAPGLAVSRPVPPAQKKTHILKKHQFRPIPNDPAFQALHSKRRLSFDLHSPSESNIDEDDTLIIERSAKRQTRSPAPIPREKSTETQHPPKN